MIQIVGPRLSQWDTGRIISVSGSAATHAHIANRGDSYAPIMDIVDGEAKIPDYLLQTGKDLCVYLVLDGVTQESNIFSVRKRERPENYVYEDDQRNYIYKLTDRVEAAIDAANQTAQALLEAKENGEFDGKDGADGKDGNPGKDGKDGAPGAAGANGYSMFYTTSAIYGDAADINISYIEHATRTVQLNDLILAVNGRVYKVVSINSDILNTRYVFSLMGATGAAGADGYTPVRGTDYWTEADKNEMRKGLVTTVNGIPPDEKGNVEIPIGNGSAKNTVLYTEQELTPEQQAQARANIGAANASVIGDISSALDELHTYAEALKGGDAV